MAAILDAFLEKLVDMLEESAKEEVGVVLGIKNDLQRLQEKLNFIKDILSDAERRRIQDAAVSRWLSKLKDVMYDADDIIDLCKIKGHQLLQGEGEPQPSTSSKRRKFNPFSFFTPVTNIPFRREIGKEIQKLNERLDEITKDRLILSLEHTSPTVRVTKVNPRQTSPLPRSDIVGRKTEKAANKLAELLVMVEGESIRVFAIVGLGGIGKTTHAQKIYNHQKLSANFQLKLWVCVSQNYSATELLKEMIRCAGSDYGQAQTKAELQPLLSSALSGKRFFLVLDDIWRADVWEDLLQTPLEHGSSRGRIVITTRNEDIAKSMGAIHTHRVDKLSIDDGWALLLRNVSENWAPQDLHDLQDIGMQIVEKCDGLPLAIKVIAGVLRTKSRIRSEWEKVHKSHAWSLKADLPEPVRGPLYFSYEDLPSKLKQCFLCCSLIPEDSKLFRDDLVSLWMSEGFITAQGDSLLEDIGEDCYNELISRSLLQLNPDYLDGNYCTMHDLMRSLALFLARDGTISLEGGLTAITSSKLRRVAVQSREDSATVLDAMKDSQCLRTLFVVECQKINLMNIFQTFTHLRILDITGSKIDIVPDSIENLQHLRHLDLDKTSICELPESIGCLTNLQILNLSRCTSLLTLPMGITRLCSLRRLGLARSSLSHVPAGTGKLKLLNNLEGFVVGDDYHQSGVHGRGCNLDELQSLSLLRCLWTDKLERALAGGIRPLEDKPYLKVLTLSCTQAAILLLNSKVIEQVFEELSPSSGLETLCLCWFYGLRFPGWMTILPNLTELRLKNCLSCTKLPPLGELPQLKLLYIAGASAVLTIGPEFLWGDTKNRPGCSRTPSAFPKLEFLCIEEMSNWEEWECDVEKVAGGRRENIQLLPHLKGLETKECPKLRALPKVLQHATSLNSFYIRDTDRLTEIGNLLFLESLKIKRIQGLERISNLPSLRMLSMQDSCGSLRFIEDLDRLNHLQLSTAPLTTFQRVCWNFSKRRAQMKHCRNSTSAAIKSYMASVSTVASTGPYSAAFQSFQLKLTLRVCISFACPLFLYGSFKFIIITLG